MENKKLAVIFMVIVSLFIIFSSVFGVSITHFAPKYALTTANVNLRNKPTTNSSSIVKTIANGSKIKLVGTIDNYYIVQTSNNEVGLILKDYIKENNVNPNNLVYTDYLPYYAVAKSDNTLIRGGPSTSFPIYGKLKAKESVYVIGKIENFLLIITSDNLVGMVREDLLQFDIQEEETNNETTPQSEVNIQNILDKINNEREKVGIPKLALDSLVTATAQAKAQDMVKNNYFSHTSPIYGTPFEMMSNAGIQYYTAGENIAGNNNIDDAINSFLNSDEHSINLLSNAYNYIGIGIEPSDNYGYVIVLMFIGK